MSNTGINRAEPGKRPRSFISPMILRNDDYLMGIGSPGGKRIPAVVSQVILRHFYFDVPLQEAIDHPRFYAEKDQIYVESVLSKKVLTDLGSRGYHVEVRRISVFLRFSTSTCCKQKRKQNLWWSRQTSQWGMAS